MTNIHCVNSVAKKKKGRSGSKRKNILGLLMNKKGMRVLVSFPSNYNVQLLVLCYYDMGKNKAFHITLISFFLLLVLFVFKTNCEN